MLGSSEALLKACGLWLLSLIGMLYPVSAQEYISLARKGHHVCHNLERYERAVVVAVRESYMQIDYTPCNNFLKWFVCTKSSLYYRVAYRQEIIQAHRTVKGCCPGFVQNGTHCSPCLRGTYGPNCSRTCPECLNGFGTCEPRDGVCTCLDGYHGENCDKGCSRGWYGKNCLQKCQCPTKHHKCNRITGDCHCRSRRCSDSRGHYHGGGADKIDNGGGTDIRGHGIGTGIRGRGDGKDIGGRDRIYTSQGKILKRTGSNAAVSQYQTSSFLKITLGAITLYYFHTRRT
ncbi:multiple epidermal growth factor-like domains protein 10 [Amphiura filiformis]|uniref:multiple epidermal growth factor-like domains protein 10 n=1 Tax=Amphiura filiformis TaxID=82378 RepID=UPI003B21A0D5